MLVFISHMLDVGLEYDTVYMALFSFKLLYTLNIYITKIKNWVNRMTLLN